MLGTATRHKSMKKILAILILGLLCSGTTFAEESKPKYTTSLNKNIIEHGWKVKSKRFTSDKDIYTLTKDGWILVCLIVYKERGYIISECSLP